MTKLEQNTFVSATNQLWTIINDNPNLTFGDLTVKIMALGFALSQITSIFNTLEKRGQIKCENGIYAAVGEKYMTPIVFEQWLAQQKENTMTINTNDKAGDEWTKKCILDFITNNTDVSLDKIYNALTFTPVVLISIIDTMIATGILYEKNKFYYKVGESTIDSAETSANSVTTETVAKANADANELTKQVTEVNTEVNNTLSVYSLHTFIKEHNGVTVKEIINHFKNTDVNMIVTHFIIMLLNKKLKVTGFGNDQKFYVADGSIANDAPGPQGLTAELVTEEVKKEPVKEEEVSLSFTKTQINELDEFANSLFNYIGFTPTPIQTIAYALKSAKETFAKLTNQYPPQFGPVLQGNSGMFMNPHSYPNRTY